jgi:hypothetical protein
MDNANCLSDNINMKGRDFVSVARRVVEQAIGEHLDGTPLERTENKSAVAVARGRLGGAKGGPARAAKLTPVQRKSIAVRAAQKRWGKPVLKRHTES